MTNINITYNGVYKAGWKRVIKTSRKGVKHVTWEKFFYTPLPPMPMEGIIQTLVKFEGTSEQVDLMLKKLDEFFLSENIQASCNSRLDQIENRGMNVAKAPEEVEAARLAKEAEEAKAKGDGVTGEPPEVDTRPGATTAAPEAPTEPPENGDDDESSPM